MQNLLGKLFEKKITYATAVMFNSFYSRNWMAIYRAASSTAAGQGAMWSFTVGEYPKLSCITMQQNRVIKVHWVSLEPGEAKGYG